MSSRLLQQILPTQPPLFNQIKPHTVHVRVMFMCFWGSVYVCFCVFFRLDLSPSCPVCLWLYVRYMHLFAVANEGEIVLIVGILDNPYHIPIWSVLALLFWTIWSRSLFQSWNSNRNWNRLRTRQNKTAEPGNKYHVALCWWFSWTCLNHVHQTCYCRVGGKSSSTLESLHNLVTTTGACDLIDISPTHLFVSFVAPVMTGQLALIIRFGTWWPQLWPVKWVWLSGHSGNCRIMWHTGQKDFYWQSH